MKCVKIEDEVSLMVLRNYNPKYDGDIQKRCAEQLSGDPDERGYFIVDDEVARYIANYMLGCIDAEKDIADEAEAQDEG